MKSLRIGVHDIPVIQDKQLREHGQYNEDPMPEIRLGKSCHKPSTFRTATLLHEAMHAMLAQAGVSDRLGEDTEELVVRCLEIGVIRLIQDNPEFSNELLKERSDG